MNTKNKENQMNKKSVIGKKSLCITVIQDGLSLSGAWLAIADEGYQHSVGIADDRKFPNIALAMLAAKAVRDSVIYAAPEMRVEIFVSADEFRGTETDYDHLLA